MQGITVRLDYWLKNTGGTNTISVDLSGDGGGTWTALKSDSSEPTSETTVLYGGPSDTWSRGWSASALSNANFRVRVTMNLGNSGQEVNLDWIPVRVYYGPIGLVQTIGTNTRSSVGNSTVSLTVSGLGVGAGDSVIVAVTAGTFAGAVSCSDSKGNTYAVDADVIGAIRLFVCSAHNVTALASGDTITASYPGFSGLTTISANEFAGLSSIPVDRWATATGNNASPSSGSTAATTKASELLFAAIAHNSTPTFTEGAGYALVGQVIGGSGSGQRTLSPEYRIVSSIGSYAADGSLSGGQQWEAVIVTYKTP